MMTKKKLAKERRVFSGGYSQKFSESPFGKYLQYIKDAKSRQQLINIRRYVDVNRKLEPGEYDIIVQAIADKQKEKLPRF